MRADLNPNFYRSPQRPSPLRLERLARGMTLRQVEREVSIHSSALGLLERGEMELRGSRLARLAAFYGREAFELRDAMRTWCASPDGEPRLRLPEVPAPRPPS